MPMNDDSLVKIMSTLGLDFNPAEQAIKSFESKITSLNKQLFEMKALAMQGAREINAAFSSQLGQLGGGKVIFDQFGQPLKTVQTEAIKAAVKVGDISAAYTKSSSAAKKHAESVQEVAKKYSILDNEFQRRASWFLTGKIFYGSIEAAKEAAKTIADVEMGVVEIARVMEDSTFSFKEYRDELLQLGIEYGKSFETVQDIALRWAQAGYNVRDSLDLTRTALLALNTAELDAKNATESMIGIMAQWQLTAQDLPLLLDKINKTADDFTVTSQDLIDGLLRSSGAAKIMGLSLEETISLLTVMREASGRTGQEVGNALNSILSYVQRPKSIETFERMGIQVFADQARTQFRNVLHIFEDVAAKWDTLSTEIQQGFIQAADDAGLFNEELATALGLQEQWNDLQQRDISQAAAGVYRRNYFIGMIERLSQAQEVLNNMTDAAGYSMRENERTMDTLEMKYESLKTAMQQLAVALGDAGLLDLLKNITDWATNSVSSISKLEPRLQSLLFTALELLAVAKAIKSIGALFGVDATLGAAMNAMPKWLGTAAAAAPGWTKLIPLILAAASAISLYVANLSKATSSTDTLRQKQEEIIKTYQSQVDAANEMANKTLGEAKTAEFLADKLEELSQKENLNVAEKAQLKFIVEQLTDIFPNLSLKIDEQTGKIIGNTKAIRDNIEALKEQAIAQAYQSKAQAASTAYVEQELLVGQTQTELDRARAELAAMQAQYGPLLKEINDIRARRRDFPNSNAVGRAIADAISRYGAPQDIEFQYEQQQAKVQDLASRLIDQRRKLDDLEREIQNYTTQAINRGASTTGTELNSNAYEQYVILYKGDQVKYVKESEVDAYLAQGWSTSYSSASAPSATYKNTALENALKELDHKKRINQISISDEIAYLQKIQSLYVKTSDERMEIIERLHDAEQRLKDEALKKAQEVYREQEELIKHWSTLGIYSIEQQIQKYRELYAVTSDSIVKERERIENLFSLYKRLLNEQQSTFKDAYSERIRIIEKEAEAKKKAQQEVIKGIEEELELLKRREDEHDYEQKMADLQEELAYWSVRTGEEARKKLAEIRKQIAEAEHDREVELQKQTLEDKKKAAEEEIDAIEEAAKAEREKWETSYKLIEKAFDEHSSNIVARAAAMSKEAYQEWVNNYLIPLQNALQSGNLIDFESIANNIGTSINQLPSHDWGMTEEDYQRFIANGIKWAELRATGGSLAEMQRLNEENNALRLKYGRDPALGEYPKFHTGAKTLSYGLAMFKPGELVFPPDLSTKLENLIQALYVRPVQQIQTPSITDNRKETKIDKLVNIENFYAEDESDSEILAKELWRVTARI